MVKKPLATRQDAIVAIRESGYSRIRIAERFGITVESVHAKLYRYKLYVCPALNLHTDKEIRAVIDTYSSLKDLRTHFGIGRKALYDALNARGITTGYARRQRKLVDVDTEVLARMYQECGYSIRRLGKMLGVHYSTAQRELKKRGIAVLLGRSTLPWDREELYELHVVREHTLKEIAVLYDTSYQAVRYALKRFSIPLTANLKGNGIPETRPHKEMTDEGWDVTPEVK